MQNCSGVPRSAPAPSNGIVAIGVRLRRGVRVTKAQVSRADCFPSHRTFIPILCPPAFTLRLIDALGHLRCVCAPPEGGLPSCPTRSVLLLLFTVVRDKPDLGGNRRIIRTMKVGVGVIDRAHCWLSHYPVIEIKTAGGWVERTTMDFLASSPVDMHARKQARARRCSAKWTRSDKRESGWPGKSH